MAPPFASRICSQIWQVADATGSAAQPNEAIACGIGCHFPAMNSGGGEGHHIRNGDITGISWGFFMGDIVDNGLSITIMNQEYRILAESKK